MITYSAMSFNGEVPFVNVNVFGADIDDDVNEVDIWEDVMDEGSDDDHDNGDDGYASDGGVCTVQAWCTSANASTTHLRN